MEFEGNPLLICSIEPVRWSPGLTPFLDRSPS